MRTDIAILGGGVIGASIAHHLAARGCDVMVLDRGEQLGSGSTAKATGGFRAQFDNETEVRLSLLSRTKLLAFEEETGVDSGYRAHGYLFLACSEADLELLRAAQKVQHACGLTEAWMVSADEARALNPAIGDATVIGGTFCPTDGFLRPMNILRGYAASAQRKGARFESGVAFEGFRVEGDRVIAARTSKGDVQARVFVNALGAWSGAPVFPMRRNVAATIATDVLGEAMPMTIWSGDWYHLRVREGRVLLLWPDDPPFPHWLWYVQRMTRERVPCLANVAIDECWSGLYEMTPDGKAIVGWSPRYENVMLATGCSGHGVMHSPAIGQLVAEWVVDGRPSMEIGALDPGRFQECGGRATALE
ncbi:MAG: FAD-binding oxidoreductase, partial [Acidobacteriota bacterium]|nr:FAD-binding oxidoreductase [Acidobacteriota bacterium]